MKKGQVRPNWGQVRPNWGRGKTSFPPSPIEPGDQICIIDPANAFTDEGIRTVTDFLTAHGFQVKISEDMAFRRGTPMERAGRLNEVIRDPKNRGIFCMWGGYGTMTLLDLIDYDALVKNKPVFAGFSDITAMHAAIAERTGMITFHSPSLCSKKRPGSPEALTLFLDMIMHPEKQWKLQNLNGEPMCSLRAGNFSGLTTGGNLTLISRLMGTPYEVYTRGKILFLEEVGEKPYRIHGMLTQLKLAGKLQAAAGILIGGLTDCDLPDRPGSALDAVRDVLSDVQVPAVADVMAGHVSDALTIPLNCPVSVTGNEHSDPDGQQTISFQIGR